MLYIDHISFPNEDVEWQFRVDEKRTCFNTMYPFFTLSKKQLTRLDFEPLTILAGGNGCGKTTALNVIAQKLSLMRTTPFNRSSFFDDYVALCDVQIEETVPDESKIITSDDVFEFMLDLRKTNQGIDARREDLYREHEAHQHQNVRVRSLEDYDALKRQNEARRKTLSSFVRDHVEKNIVEQSNGESALYYFKERVQADALYLLDEPENSLSVQKQLELKAYLEESVRYLGCQLIIATHSPFLMSMKNAKIYNMDDTPVTLKKWTEIENVKKTFDFFMQHQNEFE